MRWIAVMTALLAGEAAAQDDELDRLILDALDQMAGMAGQLDACPGEDTGLAALQEEAARLAEWKRPGLWAGITGGRASLRAELLRQTDASYQTGRVEGCPPPLVRHTYEVLIAEASRVFANATRD